MKQIILCLMFSLGLCSEAKAQTKTLVAGGNDARSVKISGEGARVIAVSVPTRYLHSPSCVMKKEDITATFTLLKAFLENFD